MTSPVQRSTDVSDTTSRSPFDHEISDLTWHEEEGVFGHPEKFEAEEPRRHAIRIIEPERNSAGSADRAEPSTTVKDEPNPQSSKSRFKKWTGRSSKAQQGVEGSKDANDDDAASDFSDYTEQAKRIARTFTKDFNASENNAYSGSQTPSADKAYAYDYDEVPTPKTYKPSIFGALLSSKLQALESDTIQTKRKLYSNNDARASRSSFNGIKESLTGKVIGGHSRSGSTTAPGTETPKKKWFENPEHNALTSMLVHSAIPSRAESGASTPKKMKWYDKPEHSALASMLVHSALPMAGPGLPETKNAMPRRPRVVSRNPSEEKLLMSSMTDLEKGMKRRSAAGSFDTEATLIAELRDIIACKQYLIKLCGAFMKFGAPSHRLEEYLSASARALAIQAEFLYVPGAMICTFIDTTTHNNSVDVVRKNVALDLGRLKDVFNVYKLVIHEKMTAEEGAEEVEKIIKRRDRQGDWFRILMFGLASLVVGPFSFSTRPIDFGPIFVLGCCLGWAQVRLVPKSEHFSNVFEVFACVVIAFISRALGSIKWHGGQEYVFCFSGVAQSSIAMILPGFMVLNSALELQSKNIVSGSVRMVYAIIYVLFLGFGLLIGTTLFGLMKRDAVTEVSCASPDWWTPGLTYRLLYTRFIWAPLFACTVALIYKAKWRQLPVMALIATAGYQANFWISTQLSSNLQVANAIGAFVIGCMANLYSRLFHGLAAAAMLPAIYCQVPGGLAASGSLVAGVNSSSQIFGNSSTISVINNGTAGFVQAQDDPNSVYGGTIFNVGYGMVQVAIGISVGLYLSALVVYPFGKSRSGLFSF